jgi:hypothetical protein
MVSGVLQAYVLTTLAALFISSAVEINEEDLKMKEEGKKRSSIREIFYKKFGKEKANGKFKS